MKPGQFITLIIGTAGALNRGLLAFALAAYTLGCPLAFADTRWSGTLDLFGEGNIYKDSAKIFLEFTIDNAGQVSGKGNATITPSPRVFFESDNCTFMHTVTPNTFEVAVEGQREPGEIQLSIRPLSTATLHFSTLGGPGRNCKATSSPPTPGMNPLAGLSLIALGVKFRVRDWPGAGKSGHETMPGGFKIDWELHVWCHDCCRNGDHGFVFLSGAKIEAHKEANAQSPVSWVPPHGARVMFRDVQEKNGTRWYNVSAGPLAGWVPSSQVSCDRPLPLPPGKKLYLEDTGLGNAHGNYPMDSAAAG
jgi:hypothetical protein